MTDQVSPTRSELLVLMILLGVQAFIWLLVAADGRTSILGMIFFSVLGGGNLAYASLFLTRWYRRS